MSEGWGFKSRPTNRKKLLDLSCLLIDYKDHGVAVMSIVIELLVLLEKKNVYCIDDILPKKETKISKKMYFSL